MKRFWRVPVLMTALAVSVVPTVAGASHHHEFGELVRPGRTELLSVNTRGAQANGRSGDTCAVDGPSISDDGRRVAFTSHASNLDSRDVNGGALPDVYVRDRVTGKTTLASLNNRGLSSPAPAEVMPGGLCTPHPSGFVGTWEPAISGDGRFVAFTSTVPLTGNAVDVLPFSVIYVHDLKTKTTELVSVPLKGEPLGSTFPDGASQQPAISENGRYISFLSAASNLVEEPSCTPLIDGPLSGCYAQLYLYDRKKDQTRLISITHEGAPSPLGVQGGSSSRHSLSDDGGFAVFVSKANLTPNDVNSCTSHLTFPPGCSDVYLHDVKKGRTELVSVGRSGISTDSYSSLMVPGQAQSVSADGRFVVFESDSRDLVPATPVLASDSIFVRDRKTGRMERIGASTGEYLGGSRASISDDGRFVMQYALGGNAIVGEASGEWSGNTAAVIRHDRRTGQSEMVKIVSYKGEWQGTGGGSPVISGSARQFVWPSLERHGFEDANEDHDVFLRDLGRVPALGTAFTATGKGRFSIDPKDSRDGLMRIPDAVDDQGGGEQEIIGAALAYRAASDDLYVKIDLERIETVSPLFAGHPGLVYGISFAQSDSNYQVRISGGPQPRFGLFRCSSACAQVASLQGGYGTTGESVVATIPLDLLGSPSEVTFRDLSAFSSFGSYELGPLHILDQAKPAF